MFLVVFRYSSFSLKCVFVGETLKIHGVCFSHLFNFFSFSQFRCCFCCCCCVFLFFTRSICLPRSFLSYQIQLLHWLRTFLFHVICVFIVVRYAYNSPFRLVHYWRKNGRMNTQMWSTDRWMWVQKGDNSRELYEIEMDRGGAKERHTQRK